jgi:hypothetical protein
MKKKILIITLPIVIILALMVTPVLAKTNQTNGTPFDEIWAAIAEMRGAIQSLQQHTDVAYGLWAAPLEPYSVVSNTWTKIPFDRAPFDNTLEGFDLDNHVFIAPVTGIYTVTANLLVQDAGDGNIRVLQIGLGNSTRNYTVSQQPRPVSPSESAYSIGWTGILYGGNKLRIAILHDSASSIYIYGGTNINITKLYDLE